MFTTEIVELLRKANFGNRAFAQSLIKAMRAENKEQIVADELIATLAVVIDKSMPLTAASRMFTNKLSKLLDVDTGSTKDSGMISTGLHFIDIISRAGLVDVKLTKCVVDMEVKDQWHLIVTDESFQEYLIDQKFVGQLIDPRDGVQEWKKPYLYKDGKRLTSIVRKMDRYKVGQWYTIEQMPDVYSAINRLGAVEWEINNHVLEIAMMEGGFIPIPVSKEAVKGAIGIINRSAEQAIWVMDMRIKSLYEHFGDEANEQAVRSLAKTTADEWQKVKTDEAKRVASSWSQRYDFDMVLSYAKEWEFQTLNFTYNCDTRGRVYALQSYLNPQGSDISKALLQFKNPKKLNIKELLIHIANCFGEDKGSFEERVEWSTDNIQDLIEIGRDPWGNYDLITKFGLENEKKTKWQALAACNVLYQWYVSDDPDNFMTKCPMGADATSSGVQIMTAIGRDEKAAPYVNLTATENGRVGDYYQYVWDNGMVPLLQEAKGHTDLLDEIIETYGVGHKMGRKASKRPDMTYGYSSTRTGMKDMYFDDRKDIGGLFTGITMKEAKVLGHLNYDACETVLTKAAELMKYMRDGMDYYDGGAIVSWLLPSGFRAFQAKDKSKKAAVNGEVNGTKVSLVYYVWQDTPNKVKHKNAISPDIIHSIDAWLLMMIVNKLPEGANIHVIHDQFGTDSCHMGELKEIAKEAYITISDRKVFTDICESAFGVRRELPAPGKWNPEEIHNSQFVIC